MGRVKKNEYRICLRDCATCWFWGLFSFCQGLQDGFIDFEGYAGVAVGDFGDLILGGDADELGDLGWVELVVVGEPLGHVAGGVAEGVVE